MIGGILFDKDGTLLDFTATWSAVNRRVAAFAAHGDPDLTDRLLRAGGADPETGVVAADSVLAAGNTVEIASVYIEAGAPFALEPLTAAIDALFTENATHVVPVTDLPALFRRLKARGLKLGIASSDSEAAIHRTAAHCGIDDLLDYVAGYDSGHGVKPHPGMLDGFCRATGLAPVEVAMVGDNTHDLVMGRAAGAGQVIGVLTGTGTTESLGPLADHCLPSIEHLDKLLFGGSL